MQQTDRLKTMERYLTTTEVIGLLKVRRNTLCDWVRSGRIPAILIGSSYRFDPMALAEWIEIRQTS